MNRTARSWLTTLAVVGLLLGMVAVFGGFQPARASELRQLPVGEPVELGRWSVQVHSAVLTNTWPSGEPLGQSVVRIHLTYTNTGVRSGSGPGIDILAFRGPHGYLAAESNALWTDEPTVSTIGPGLTRQGYLEFPITDSQWHDGAAILAVLGYETATDGGFAQVGVWELHHVIGAVPLVCRDERR